MKSDHWLIIVRSTDRFLPQSKDILVHPIIPRHFAVTIHISTSLSWTCNDSCYSSHVKNSDLIWLNRFIQLVWTKAIIMLRHVWLCDLDLWPFNLETDIAYRLPVGWVSAISCYDSRPGNEVGTFYTTASEIHTERLRRGNMISSNCGIVTRYCYAKTFLFPTRHTAHAPTQQRSLAVAVPTTWNCLPDPVRIESNSI